MRWLTRGGGPRCAMQRSEMYRICTGALRDYVTGGGFYRCGDRLVGRHRLERGRRYGGGRLGADHVHGVLLPGPYSSEHSIFDAEELARNLHIETRTISICEPFEAFERVLGAACGGELSGLAAEDTSALPHAMRLWPCRTRHDWMRCSTSMGNKSRRRWSGYSTLYQSYGGGVRPHGRHLQDGRVRRRALAQRLRSRAWRNCFSFPRTCWSSRRAPSCRPTRATKSRSASTTRRSIGFWSSISSAVAMSTRDSRHGFRPRPGCRGRLPRCVLRVQAAPCEPPYRRRISTLRRYVKSPICVSLHAPQRFCALYIAWSMAPRCFVGVVSTAWLTSAVYRAWRQDDRDRLGGRRRRRRRRVRLRLPAARLGRQPPHPRRDAASHARHRGRGLRRRSRSSPSPPPSRPSSSGARRLGPRSPSPRCFGACSSLRWGRCRCRSWGRSSPSSRWPSNVSETKRSSREGWR